MSNQWKPKKWLSILYGIFFQPFVFLYVNRPKLFWVYLLASISLGALEYIFKPPLPLGIILLILIPLHAFFIAKSYDTTLRRCSFCNWWGVPSIFAVTILAIFLFRSFLFEPFNIPAASMSPSINPGDLVITKKWGYGDYGTFGLKILNKEISNPSAISRGEMYVFYPPNSDEPYLKRVIGLPGDELRIDGEKVYVNSKELKTDLVSQDGSTIIFRETIGDKSYLIQKTDRVIAASNMQFVVPENHYFFLGDNRNHSADSRIWGYVPSSDFVGKVIFVYSP